MESHLQDYMHTRLHYAVEATTSDRVRAATATLRSRSNNLRPRPRRHGDARVDDPPRACVEDVVDGLELRRAQVLGR